VASHSGGNLAEAGEGVNMLTAPPEGTRIRSVPAHPKHRTVVLATRDLFFRSKLGAIVRAAGAEVARDAATCDLAVVELGGPGPADRIRELVARGIPVLAFGSHVKPDELRAARELGAVAVPNSQVEERLRGMLD